MIYLAERDDEKKYNGVQKIVNTMKVVGGICLFSVIANGGIFYLRHVDEERLRTEHPYPSERMDAFETRLSSTLSESDTNDIRARLNITDGVAAMLYLNYKQEAEKKNEKATWSSFMDELASARSLARKSGGLPPAGK